MDTANNNNKNHLEKPCATSPSLNNSRNQPYIVRRPVYSLFNFEQRYGEKNSAGKGSYHKRFLEYANRKCTPANWLKALNSFFPFFDILRKRYKLAYIPWDILAGFTMAIFQVPQGLAYAMLASVPPVYGLYTSFYPAILYFIFGTSMHVSVGTFSLVCLMMGELVRSSQDKYAPIPHIPKTNQSSLLNLDQLDELTSAMNSSDNDITDNIRVEIVLCATFFIGIIQLAMGLLRLGFLTSYLSDAMVSGFTTASAFHIIVSQLKDLLGISLSRSSGVGKLPKTVVSVFENITSTNVATLITSIICIIILVVVKEFINPRVKKKIKAPLPIELILVVFALIVSKFGRLHSQYQITVVGDIPSGMPPPKMPNLTYTADVITGSFPIAIVGFASTVSLCKIFCLKFKYDADYNQELNALGIVNIVGSFFSSIGSAGALARTNVIVDVGMKSQIAGLISASGILLVIYFIGNLFSDLPKCALAAIIVVSLKGLLMQLKELKRLWTVSIFDFLIWLVTFLATIFLDVSLGLAVGFVFSILCIVFRTQKPDARLLGRIPNTDIYKDVKVYPKSLPVHGVLIFRFAGAVYFANADYFKCSLFKKTGINPEKIVSREIPVVRPVKGDSVSPHEPSSPVRNANSDKKVDWRGGEIQEAPQIVVEMHDSDQQRPVSLPRNSQSMNTLPQSGKEAGKNDQTDNYLTVNSTYSPGSQLAETARSLSQVSNKSSIGTLCPVQNSGVESTPVHHIIMDCSGWSHIDSMGMRVLKEVIDAYKKVDIQVYLASCKANLRRMFVRTKLYEKFDKEHVYLTIHDAVLAALNDYEDQKRKIMEDISIYEEMVELQDQDDGQFEDSDEPITMR